jgi:hypothetical protein
VNFPPVTLPANQDLKTAGLTPFATTGCQRILPAALAKGAQMNLIYNSEQYSVVEFGADDGREALRFGGYEIMDKPGKKEIFIGGSLAEAFRKNVEDLIATEPSVEEIDAFLGKYDSLMSQPVVFH